MEGVITAAKRSQSLNALGQAGLLIGRDRPTRLDAPESPPPIALDNWTRARDELPSIARYLVDGAGREIARDFLSEPAERYVPCR